MSAVARTTKPLSKLEQLWQIAYDMNIYPDFYPLSAAVPGLLGIYMAGCRAILLDESLRYNLIEQTGVMAEEIGHAKTAPRTDMRRVYDVYRRNGECNETIMMAQDERAAQFWAANWCISDIELKEALASGYQSCWELAEHFGVPEWIVHMKMGSWKVCGRYQGLKIKGKDIFRMGFHKPDFST